MPVTEVQWIGASCGRHSSYTFYRGFRLIVDGIVKNFCLGEFYFVRNSTNDPICIAELQLVWHDASSDSQLASARLYFRPEDTPVGRLPNHGQDELLYADQKVVIKCHDMAVWEDSGLQWDSGMVPLYERDFVCIDDRYYLNSHYDLRETERFQTTSEAWEKVDQPRNLLILTFPAYCRYRALKKRLLSGACLSKAQLVALGGILGDQRSTRVLFCRDSFHHPYLDKFELSGDNKAPVLKGRPRKKKKLNVPQNSVLRKKRFVADIQNHLGGSPVAKRCKISEEDESASSDMSEGVMEQIKVPPQAPRAAQNSDSPSLMKPKVQIIPKGATQNVPLTSPPPLISSNSFKGDVQHSAQVSREQVNAKTMECSQTTPMEKQIHSVDLKLKKLEKANNNNNGIELLDKSQPVDNNQARVTSDPLTTPSSSLCRTVKTLTTSAENKQLLQPQAAKVATNPLSMEQARTVTAGQAEMRSLAANTRPVATTQGTVGTQVAVSTGPIVRTQPVASLPQPVASAQAVAPKPQQSVTLVAGSALSAVKPSDVGNTGALLSVRSKPTKENEDKQSRLTACVSEERKENEMDHRSEEPVVWKKKKKRLRMPGSVKDEVYDDEDEKYFMQTLGDFMRKNNQPLGKLPALGFKKVNLWTMYTTAQRFGGYDAVTSKRLWRRVYDSLGGSTTITSAATYTRRHYERLLLPYERHIRSQLKKQMDEKNPSSVNELTPKDPLNKPEKKQGLTESNNKQTSSTSPDKDKVPVVKHELASTGANPVKAPQKGAVLSTPQKVSAKVNVTSSAQGNALKTAPSSHTMQTAALSTVSENFVKHDLPPAAARPFKQEHHESKTWSNRTKAEVSQPSVVPTERREKVIPSEHFKASPTYQHTSYRCIKVMSSDEETSARTNTIYTKNTTGVNSNPKPSVRAASPRRVTRVVHDVAPKSSSPQQLTTASKGREVIDLTSDDSPPRPQSKNLSVPRVQISQGNGNTQETCKVSQTVSSKDSGVRMRHAASKSQLRKEYEGGSRHQSIGEVQPSKEASPVYDSQTYSVLQQVKPKVPPRLPASSPAVAVKKNPEEVYSVKQETGLPKHDKKRHQQVRVEGIDGRFTHSPSTDSVDEHFAEWYRRQSGVPPRSKPPVVSNQRHISNPDMGKLTYSYVPEDMCPPDCPCSLPTSRKDESVSVAPPKPKKEHYEEDLPFAGMTWGPAMMDHPELYISSSHGPHLPPPPDSLATHMYTASRIFIPPAQIFSPPYHMGMPPMGAPPLIAGTDDQLHIHPHCLMASPYPCSSSSRTPDGAAYPLYSFT